MKHGPVDYYRPLRNRTSNLAWRESLYVIWAYSQRAQIKNFQFPGDIEVTRKYLEAERPGLVVPEWELEIIAREVVLNGGPGNRKDKSLRQWNTLAGIIQSLRDLENEIYGAYGDQANVLIELIRIMHRQLVWQQHYPRSSMLYRYYRIFDIPEIDEVCREKTGLSVYDIYIIGLGLVGTFLNSARIKREMSVSVRGLSPAKVELFLKFTSRSVQTLKRLLREQQAIDEGYAYRYSWLRAYPLIEIQHCGEKELACPLPTLLFWRMTSGLYYELAGDDRFFNAFGQSFQTYVGEVIARAVNPERFQVLAEESYGSRKKRKDTVDWIVAEGAQAALFIECKTMRLTWASKAGLTDLSALKDDINKLASAIVQVYEAIAEYQQNLYPSLPYQRRRRIFPVTVTLEDWYLFGGGLLRLLDNAVCKRMADREVREECLTEAPYSVMSIDELETAIQVVSEVGIIEFVENKQRDEYVDWIYDRYMYDRYPELARKAKMLFRKEYLDLFQQTLNGPKKITAAKKST